MTAAGMTEIITYPMLDDTELALLNPSGDGQPVKLGFFDRPDIEFVKARNPLRSEWQQMRPTLLPSVLRNVSENLKYSPFVAVYETGRVYLPRGIDELPNERRTLTAAVAGTLSPASLYEEPREVDYFDLSGILAQLFEQLGTRHVTMRQSSHPSLHPGRAAEILAGNKPIGIAGEVHPIVAERFGIDRDRRVAIAEIDLHLLMEYGLEPFTYRPVPRYQPTQQDFAIVVAENVPAGDVRAALDNATKPLATAIQLFDVYRGASIGEGAKSLAFRVTLAAPDRALNESDLDKLRKRVEKGIKQVSGTLRS
jgi:phenylalanyl-tRNA synthetase beta chain